MNSLTYVVVLFGTEPVNCMVPDFTLLAQGATVSEAVANATKLIEESISLAKRVGTKIPNPTAESVIRKKWTSTDATISSVTVQG